MGESRTKRSGVPSRLPRPLSASVFLRSFRTAGIGLALAIVAGLLTASSASAFETYIPAGGFREEAGTEARPSVAVDETSGDVFYSKDGSILIHPGDGSSALLGKVGEGELSAPGSIAIDQSDGDLYVIDSSLGSVLRYKRTAVAPPSYSRDLAYPGPEAGAVGSYASPIAFDQASGDLLIADIGSERIERFAPDGHLISSFDGSDAPEGPFHQLIALTVGEDGSIYAIDMVSGSKIFGGTFAVEKFSAGGVFQRTYGPLNDPLALAVDPISGDLLVGADNEYAFASPTPRIHVFHEGSQTRTIPLEAGTNVVGLASTKSDSPTAGGGNFYAQLGPSFAQPNFIGIQLFKWALLPDVSISTPVATTVSAHLSGTVNPLGADATYAFEYAEAGGSWNSTATEDAGSGEAPVNVEADLSELQPNTSYEVRLSAGNASGTNTSEPVTFETLPSAPAVTEAPATDLTPTSVTVSGTVNPFGLATTFYVEWGPTTAYGSRAPLGSPLVAGAGRGPKLISETIAGLTPGSAYHYRIVAENAAGTTRGEDREIITPVAEPQRSYEQVSPVEKGSGVLSNGGDWQASEDGEAIVYQARGAIDKPEVASAPLASMYQGRRSPDGWSFRPLDPPLNTQNRGPGGVLVRTTLAVSEDESAALVASNEKLAPGGAEGAGNLYREDLTDGSFELVATGTSQWFSEEASGYASYFIFYGGSTDFTRILFRSSAPLTPEAEGGPGASIYEWHGGSLKVVSKTADGTFVPNPARHNENRAEMRAVSADGKVAAIWGAGGEGEGVYVERGGQSEAISVSHRSGAPDGVQPANLLGMSKDGRYVFFTSLSGEGLTEDAPDQAGDAYRYDTSSNSLTYVFQANLYEAFRGMSDDGSTIYFSGPTSELKVWRNGIESTVAGNWEPSGNPLGDQFKPSRDGRYLAFTGSLSGKTGEMYVYDADREVLECASCSGLGATAAGDVRAGYASTEFGGYFPRTVDDRGQVFFATSTPLVAKDVNGKPDVYEFDHGVARLISGGDADTSSYFAEASADGRDVFFVTDQQLVAQDQDHNFDLYDARVGGGISEQTAWAQAPGPSRACSGGAGAAPAPPSVASEAVSPSAKRKVRRHSRCSAGQRRKKAAKRKGTCKQRHPRKHAHGAKGEGSR
jgi:hypothetical protein